MPTHPPIRLRPPAVLLSLAMLLAAGPVLAAPSGEQIYRKQCASCHGPDGQGSKNYPHALEGDRTPAQLAKLIARTMPEDAPGTCVGEDAAAVAAYLHAAFYSAEARARNKPPRIELSRLTVRQHQQALADLVGSFRGPTPKFDDRRGLQGEYFKGRDLRQGNRVFERLDPEVHFDFGTNAPAPDKFEPHEFTIRWSGSVLAPETGTYEFVVRTEHALRLWVNDNNHPLIDAWVKSGNDTEYKASAFLLAGRAYPLRLEFTKATQGVNDPKKAKERPPAKASVALAWKRPGREAETVPARFLSPARGAESFVPLTAFPPDDRSFGWERATAVSKEWDSAATDAALETAGYVAARLPELAGAGEKGPDREAKLRDFCRRFVERAFRRPVTPEQLKVYVDRQFQSAAGDGESAVKRVVLLTLKSPRFLYREAEGEDTYATASRLAFALWDAPPDAVLTAEAAAGRLVTREQVAKQAERMLADPRAHAKLREFLLAWLKVDHAPDVAKDPKRFPGFERAIVSDLRTSLDLFLDDAVRGDIDFRQLLLGEDLYLNGPLAKFYGADLPADAAFQKVRLDGGARAGVLTHPYLLSAFAYTGTTSPIHRGVFVARGVLGLSLRPPPEAFTPFAEDLHPDLTTRERVALQTRSANCMGCHGVINPLGYPLEGFDAVGRKREKDNRKPVDTTGSYVQRSGETVKFAGARDLATFLAGSPEVHASFTEQLFHHLVKQSIRAHGPRQAEELTKAFAASGFNVRKLAIECATTAALTPRQGKKPG